MILFIVFMWFFLSLFFQTGRGGSREPPVRLRSIAPTFHCFHVFISFHVCSPKILGRSWIVRNFGITIPSSRIWREIQADTANESISGESSELLAGAIMVRSPSLETGEPNFEKVWFDLLGDFL